MADPLNTASAFALQSSRVLYQTVASSRCKQRTVRQLKEELEALNEALETLQETVANTDVDLSTIQLPLLRCGQACKDFGALISKYTADTDGSRTGIKDWTKLKYMGDDIVGFKNMLAGYKATIMIALCDVNMRTSAVAVRVIKEYQDMISNATVDLEEHLREIDDKLQSISPRGVTSDKSIAERRQIQEERDSTQQCLEICAQVGTRMDQFQPIVLENISTPSDTYQGPATKLGGATEANKERMNFFEDISTADDGHQILVSTTGKLISARRVTAGARSKQWLGQMSDETLQKFSQHLNFAATEESRELQTEENVHFEGRYGVGLKLGSPNSKDVGVIAV